MTAICRFERGENMGQALEFCVGCEHPRDCDTCVDLHEWIVEHLDAVPVVRCKECKNKGLCAHHNGRYIGQFDDDDFCSYGERKEGAD